MINFDVKKFEKLQYKFEGDSFEYNFWKSIFCYICLLFCSKYS